MGAMALFGEKYGEDVRVIRYGNSIELCGGTHVANTGNIGMIRIVSESSIAAGIRRIEAITAATVEDAMDTLQDTLHGISALLNNAPDVVSALRKSIEENADLHRQVEEAAKERIAGLATSHLEAARMVNGIKVVAISRVMVPEIVKGLAFAIREKSPQGTAFIAATQDFTGKPLLTVMLTEDVTKGGLNASQMVREAAKAIKGGGGGQPGFAQAGGKDASGLAAAFACLNELISK